MELEVGDVVICTIDRIVGTVVFVKIHGLEKEIEGSIVMSEIAPGRIRNIRDYVVPKKKIACKVLRIATNGHIDLSLRRVSKKESEEVKKKAENEQSYAKILRGIMKEEADRAIEKIRENGSLYDFLENAKENSKELENIIGKENANKILDILKAQKKKKSIVKKEINLSSTNPDGVNDIKQVFNGIKNAKIKYISGGRYTLETESDDVKIADSELRKILEEIEKRAKNRKIFFSIKEK